MKLSINSATPKQYLKVDLEGIICHTMSNEFRWSNMKQAP